MSAGVLDHAIDRCPARPAIRVFLRDDPVEERVLVVAERKTGSEHIDSNRQLVGVPRQVREPVAIDIDYREI